jgi:dihydroorotase
MKLIVKNVLIADKNSTYNGQVKDIFIVDNRIEKIGNDIQEKADTIINEANLIASPGWVDIFSNFNDPGLEYKETIETGAAAAAAGGFTQVFVLPNTQPLVHNKTQVEYIVQKAKGLSVQVHPLGAVTKNIEGKELAEMYDMQNSGAIAFSDGTHPVQTSGLLLKALQYVKAFDGTVIQMPVDKSIGALGLINEGIISTQLGLPGIPALAEELIVQRDIELVRYTNSKLHITGITTAKSVELIEKAKTEGLQVTCSVTPYHLHYCDEDLVHYDTNLKVNPPLRSHRDMMALRNAVVAGKIDCIASHHQPQDWDNKTCEFEYAKNGMIGLQTSFALLHQTLPQLTNDELVNLLSNNARNIFKLNKASITENETAELTLFSRHQTTILTKENNKSKSANTPLFNVPLNGKVIGIINKGTLSLN